MANEMGTDKPKTRRLGRGLDALMGDSQSFLRHENDSNDQKTLNVEQIGANRYNPRRYFNPDDLLDLTNSIIEKGVLQPILVRVVADREFVYEIVAGERRWRASIKAGKNTIPTIIVDLNDKEALEVAIIENVQRENLSAIEEAVGLGQLIEQFSYTQDDVAKVIGKSRSYVTNILRLLKLPNEIKQLVETGKISAGHARALLGRKNAVDLAKRIVDEELSVRDIEEIVREQEGRSDKSLASREMTEPKTTKVKSAQTLELERKLSDILGAKVAIDYKDSDTGGAKGSIKLAFKTLDQFEFLLDKLGS
ncbi:MAG: ParB/RepB/Spo0J family partition protein [Rhizobiales bacterium]|nr:ParB/RepB/Spo0J family partition protein [Hyphomicrobiales bacterium]NRB15189.1 ParB/RepB/Spo0J family partition protein [Hyphomicrobiales bacterium]